MIDAWGSELLGRNVENEASVHLHLLVVFLTLELEAVYILLSTHDLSTIESRSVGITSKDLFADRERRQSRANLRNGNQPRGCGLVDSSLFTILVGLWVLDIVPDTKGCQSAILHLKFGIYMCNTSSCSHPHRCS